MTGVSTFQDFVAQTMGEFGTVPRRGLIYVAIASGLSAATDLLLWWSDAKFSDLDYALLGLVIFSWLAAAYAATMTMIDRPLSVLGFVKFTGATILTLAPILSCLAVLVYASRAGLSDGLTVSTVIALFLIGLLFLAFLSAWPITQTISTRFVSPMRILKATKGYRWTLVIVCFAPSSLNKLVPSMSTATSIGEAIALALAGAIVGAATVVLAASIGVTAWKFALRRDGSLAHP